MFVPLVTFLLVVMRFGGGTVLWYQNTSALRGGVILCAEMDLAAAVTCAIANQPLYK